MRILVAGAGAVGSWLGGVLARGGSEIVLVARGAHGAAIREAGLGLAAPGAHASVQRMALPARATVAEAAASGPFDAVLVAVKAFDTEGIGRELAACSLAGTVVISFQNGIGNEAVLTAALAGRRIPRADERPLSDASGVIAGTLTQPAWLVEPGIVAAGAKGGAVVATMHGTQAAVASALVAGLRAGGIPARSHPDAAALKWSKLVLNLIGAATSALLGQPPGRVLRDRRWFGIERAILRESLAVMRALDLHPIALPGYPVPALAWLARALPERALYTVLAKRFAAGRSDRLPGLAADIAAGRSASEVDALHGAVAATGAVLGVPTPMCAHVRHLIHAMAAGRLACDAFAADPVTLLAALAVDDV